MFNDYITYYKAIDSKLEAAAVDDYSRQKLRDNRVTHWLHFALYTKVRFEFTRIGQVKGNPPRRVRHGNSGTREGTLQLSRIPTDVHPKGPRLSQRVIIRYFDLTRSRNAWRSFYRRNFIASFAWWNDDTNQYTIDPAELVASGQVPPPKAFKLTKGQERRAARIIRHQKRKDNGRSAPNN